MLQIIKDVDQGSDEWLNLRMGKITASNMKKVLSKGQGKTRESYMLQLASEIITNQPQESYKNEYMEWGNEVEPQARSMYELDKGIDVDQVAFMYDETKGAGYSPDGLVGENGLIEIKCPKTSTHIQWFLKGKCPAEHKAQIQCGLWISEREWCDFVSFDPRINTSSSYFCVRVYRDQIYIDDLSNQCRIFLEELHEMLHKL